MARIILPMALLLLALPAAAADRLPGPIPATVVRVVDGDTLAVRARIWPDLLAETSVRVKGVDTPELKGKCEAEKAAARLAQDFVRSLVPDGSFVDLVEVEPDKYGGRTLARIMLPDGRDFARVLIDEGLARPYAGTHRASWCGE